MYKDPEKQRQYQREWERSRQRDNSGTRRAWRDRVNEIKNTTPCTDCHKLWPYYVMQFDHIGDDKVAGINKLLRHGTWQQIEDEIKKCELVCGNCHAIRGFQRLHNSTG